MKSQWILLENFIQHFNIRHCTIVQALKLCQRFAMQYMKMLVEKRQWIHLEKFIQHFNIRHCTIVQCIKCFKTSLPYLSL